MSLGLALSGGGAKGAAHIGVLQALKEENINIEYISGTSMGSLVASLFACGYTPNEILNLVNSYFSEILSMDKKSYLKIFTTMVNATTPISGIANGYKLERMLNLYFLNKGKRNISEFNIPIAIPTVDLYTGKLIYFLNKKVNTSRWLEEESLLDEEIVYQNLDEYIYEYSASISHIVKSSCSFPGIFEPEMYKNYLLVDGGLRKNVPVSILKKMGADKVIAICFDNIKNGLKDSSIVTVAIKCVDIMGYEVNKEEIELADLVIKPKIGNTSLIDFYKSRALANEGYKEAKKMMPKIKEIIYS